MFAAHLTDHLRSWVDRRLLNECRASFLGKAFARELERPLARSIGHRVVGLLLDTLPLAALGLLPQGRTLSFQPPSAKGLGFHFNATSARATLSWARNTLFGRAYNSCQLCTSLKVTTAVRACTKHWAHKRLAPLGARFLVVTGLKDTSSKLGAPVVS